MIKDWARLFSKSAANFLLVVFVVLMLPKPIYHNIALVLLFLATVVLYFKNRPTLEWRRIPLLLMAYYGLIAISVLYSSNKEQAVFDLQLKLSLIIIPLIFILYPFSHKMLQGALAMFTIAVVAVCTYCLAINMIEAGGFYQKVNIDRFYYDLPLTRNSFSGVIGIHAGYFATFILLAQAAIYHYLLKGKKQTVVYYAGLLFCILLLEYSLVILAPKMHLAISGLLIGWFTVTLILRRVNRYVFVGLGLIVVIVGFLASRNTQILYRFDTEMSSSTRFKQQQWGAAWEVIKQNPIIGVGVGDDRDAHEAMYDELGYDYAKGSNAHNQFLQTTLQMGIIGLLGLVSLLILPFTRKVNFLEFLVMIILILTMTIESVLEWQKGVMYFAFFLCFFDALSKSPAPEPEE